MKTSNNNEKTPSGHPGEQHEDRLKMEPNHFRSPYDADISEVYPEFTNLAEELEALKPHDHLCLIYESREEWRDAVVPFLVNGLRQSEKCLYVVDLSTIDEIRRYLSEEEIDVAAVEETGQLVILQETETYTKEGSFDPDKMIALLIAETENAIAEGYQALRVTGEMTWVLRGYPGSEKVLEYEAKLNRDLFPYYPCLAICQYDRWKFDPEIIKGVIMTHPKLIRNKSVYRNFYYISPEAFLNQKSADVECQHWLTNIEREQNILKDLIESREKSVVLIENMSSALAVYKPDNDGQDFIFLNFNRAAERMDKIKREEVIGESVLKIFPGIREFGLFDVFQRVFRTGAPEYFPGSYYQDDRISCWRDNYVYKLPSGEIVTVYEDVTERKQAEEKVKRSELRYRRLFETAQDAILILNGDTGQIIDANPFIKELLGYSMDELKGKSLWEIGASKDTLASKLSYQQLLETGYVRYEHLPLISKDGMQIDVEVVANAYIVGETRVIQCNIRDVTERNRTEILLRESEAKYRALFEAAVEGIIISEIETKAFKYVNPAICTMLGYSNEELLTMSVPDIHPEDSLKEALAEFESQAKGEKTLASNIPCLKKDGTVIYFDINSTPTNINGIMCNIGFFNDISERKLIEESRERSARLESVGTLAGGIAHDFNNILTGILGNIGLAAISINSGNGNDAIARIKDAEAASFQARNLTQQLLTFSRGGAPVKQLLDCSALIRESTAFALTGSNIKPVFSLPADLWTIKADEGQLKQVISNLVINAHQSMPNGGTLNIKAENIVLNTKRNVPLPEGNYIRIHIKDHGIGIPEEYQRKIFTPYFTTKQKGSGLGLAVTYSVIKNHDGYITFESKLGIGTTFSIFLPASGEILSNEPEDEKVLLFPKDRGRILIMDDEEVILNLLLRLLKDAGMEVEATPTGAEAIALYSDAMKSENPFDAVILDLTVPGGMGGKEVIKKLIEIDPEVKAIVSSGYATDPIMADFKSYGFSGVVIKPYNIKQMLETLRSILNEK